jgi:hypothetical protein
VLRDRLGQPAVDCSHAVIPLRSQANFRVRHCLGNRMNKPIMPLAPHLQL